MFNSKSRIALVVFLVALWGCASQSDEAAHQLLYDYIDSMSNVNGTAEAKIKAVDEQRTRLHSLKGQMREDFYDRFESLLATTRLSFAPETDGASREQVVTYIKSITGSSPSTQGMDLTIAEAFAFSEEAVRLQMLLDGETNHEKAKKKFAEQLKSRRGRQH